MNRRRLVAGVALIALFFGIVVWRFVERGGRTTKNAGASGSPTRPRPGKPRDRDPSSLAVIGRAQPRQLANFSVLRKAPDGLPATTRKILGRPQFGVNWALARRLPVAVPGDYWALPGNGFLCILAQPDIHTTTGSCATTEDALAHGVAAVLIRGLPSTENTPDNRLIVGVAPDRTRKVLVRTAGSVTTVQVLDNIFILRDTATNPPDKMTLR